MKVKMFLIESESKQFYLLKILKFIFNKIEGENFLDEIESEHFLSEIESETFLGEIESENYVFLKT